jgi:predicted amidophosphoribosyltransferase
LPDRLVVATLYIPKVTGYEHSREIIALKERGEYSQVYAEVLTKVLAQENIDVSGGVIVPIPQTKARQGVTGPLALAYSLSGQTGLTIRMCLSFNRPVKRQKTLSKDERESNMRGAMTATNCADISKALLVDEVFTSGATLREGTRALMAAGAQEVIGVIAARKTDLGSLEYAGVVKRVED